MEKFDVQYATNLQQTATELKKRAIATDLQNLEERVEQLETALEEAQEALAQQTAKTVITQQISTDREEVIEAYESYEIPEYELDTHAVLVMAGGLVMVQDLEWEEVDESHIRFFDDVQTDITLQVLVRQAVKSGGDSEESSSND